MVADKCVKIVKAKNSYAVISYEDIKWRSDYEDVGFVEDFLGTLDERTEENEGLLKDNFYKFISIDGESNSTDERTNDQEDEYTDFFFVDCDFSI